MTPSRAIRAAFGALSLGILGACSSDHTFTTPTVAPPPTDTLAAKLAPLLGQIAFTSTRDGPLYIYVAAADGSSLRRLAPGVNPAWSWDGQQIAFNGTGDTTSDQPIYVINADGSGQRPLPIRGVGPVWSPDGRQLAYTTGRGINVANSDGSNSRQLVSSDFLSPDDTVGGPAWTPDGKGIAFTSGKWTAGGPCYSWDVDTLPVRCGSWQLQLYLASTDGSGIQPLLPGEASSASWSPNGSTVAFETDSGMAIANADGSAERMVTTSIEAPSSPDWSPDGRVLSFAGLAPRTTCPPVGCSPIGSRIYATSPSLDVTVQLVPDAYPPPARWPYNDFQAVWSRVLKP